MRVLFLILVLLGIDSAACAQHEHHMPAEDRPAAPPRPAAPRSATPRNVPQTIAAHPKASDTATRMHGAHGNMHADGDSTHAMSHGDHASMRHSLSRNLPMSRNGSGTGWNPDAVPMYMYMKHKGAWMYMLHGNVFLRYNNQDPFSVGSRGAARWDAPSMVMAMGQRPVGRKGLFHVAVMLSADAIITGQRGYPLLFQSGESAHGEPLVDRQHPHDLFSELSVSYAHAFTKDVDAYLYAGYPGEPALGATTFMHRASGIDNPDAPLSHHWVDATHITFGVVTAGIRYRKWKLEGSSFTGREPGENRYNFDRPRFDSRSARLWYAPSQHWAIQVSHGFLRSPEALHPDEDVSRTTASASYSKAFRGEHFFNATALWGVNQTPGHNGEHAILLEAALRKNRHVVYGRYDWVQKSVEELALNEATYGHDALFGVHALTLGTGYDLIHGRKLRAMLGMQGSVYRADDRLELLYGSYPVAAQAYLRIYPSLMRM